ncbi:MAG: fimbrillin family protein [Bacteroidales bacterium]|nr:fimbrillin family protein [Bacteroidales bacterium]
MKKRSIKFGALPIMALAVTACSSNEDLNMPQVNTDANAISFSVQTPNLTRAAASYCNNVPANAFRVVVYDGRENYFQAADKAKDPSSASTGIDSWSRTDESSAWVSANDKRYWPENKPADWEGLTFFSSVYSGDDLSYDQSATSGFRFVLPAADAETFAPQFKDFQVQSEVAEQHDLMYATSAETKKKQSGNGKVTLNFRHALSQICFTAQNNNQFLRAVTIKSIELGGVSGKGDYTLPTASTINLGVTNHSSYGGTDPEGAGEWSVSSNAADKASYVIGGEGDKSLNVLLAAPVYEDGSYVGAVTNISKPTTDHIATEEITKPFENAMNLIPQTVSAAAGDNGTNTVGGYIRVVADMKYSDEESAESVEKTVFIPLDIDWKEGVRYNYNIIFTPTEITFETSFSDYNDVTVDKKGYEACVYKKVLMRKAQGTPGEAGYVPPLYFADRNVGASSPVDGGLLFQLKSRDAFYVVNGLIYDQNMNYLSDDKKYPAAQKIANQCSDSATEYMGPEWRMPTLDEVNWLINESNCHKEKVITPNNYVLGYIFTPVDEELKDNSIFLPMCSYFFSGGPNTGVTESLYWTSTGRKALGLSTSNCFTYSYTDNSVLPIRAVSNVE